MKNKIYSYAPEILGVLTVGLATGAVGYFLYKNSKQYKKYTNFTQTDLDACMAANPTSGLAKCCEVVGGSMVNGVCTDIKAQQCTASGGIWDGATCTPCTDATHMIYNGVCMPDAQVKCITEQAGNWVNGTCVCPAGMQMQNGICVIIDKTPSCKANEVLSNGVCVCASGYHNDSNGMCVANAPASSTTTITFPPFFPSYTTSGGGGGGGAEEQPKTDIFDWIPWILAGMTTALSVVSEQKK